MWKKLELIRIIRQPPLQIVTDQEHLLTVKYFNYLCSIIDNARCQREIKCRTAMAKAAFNRKKTHFTSKLELNLRKKLVKC